MDMFDFYWYRFFLTDHIVMKYKYDNGNNYRNGESDGGKSGALNKLM